MFKSLRYRLLIWFIFSTILIAVLSFLLFHVHKSNKTEHWLAVEKLEFLKYQFLKDQKKIADFVASDIHDNSFYISGESPNLNEHYKLINSIDSCFVDFFSGKNKYYPGLDESLHHIRNTYTAHSMLLDSLVYNLYKRGYDNFGLMGEISGSIFKIENSGILSQKIIRDLQLAGNSYFLKSDSLRLNKIRVLCNSTIAGVVRNRNYTQIQKAELINWLKTYRDTFIRIAALDRKLGTSESFGFKQSINELGDELEKLINLSISDAKVSFDIYVTRLNLIFGFGAFLLIALAFVISVYTSRYLVQNLEQLTHYISELTRSNFRPKINLDLKHSTREIRQIYIEFRNMIAELKIKERQRDLALKVSQENQQRYQELTDLLPQGIYETDRMGNLTYVNQAWYKTFGYSPEDINKGINIVEILNTDPSSGIFGFSKEENNDYLATRKDGSKFPATVYSDVIRKGINIVGRRGIIIDSTLRNRYIDSLRKEAVKAINSDQHKSSFLANMSHEIRTPMNSIIGFANMLSSKEIQPEQKDEFIHHIQSSSEMLLDLIDDIIDIAKIEAGRLNIRKTTAKPINLIHDLKVKFEGYKNRLEKENLAIELDLPENELPFRTDEFRLRQILSNLISNAIKFTEEGKVIIGLKIKSPQFLGFYVADTGIGMSREELTNVFDRFKRSEISEEKKISGTGLGLTISKNLVEMLGGKMWVESEPGEGSRFSFEIPYLREDKLDEIHKPEPEVKNYDWSDKTILIAEDDRQGYKLLEEGLKSSGARLIHAVNGKEAIEAVHFHNSIDIILMDMQMPVLTGLEAVVRIKEERSNLPVIAQTAFAMEGDREICLAGGCDDYITKPINMPGLLAKISQFIDKPSGNQSIGKKEDPVISKTLIEKKNIRSHNNNSIDS